MKKSSSPSKKALPVIALCAVGFVVLLVLALVFSGMARPASGEVYHPQVEISEYMSSNKAAYPDENGVFSDWIELHNTTGSAVSLNGWALSDGSTTWMFASGTIPADGYLVVFCDGEGKSALHATLRLSRAGGETITLTNSAGQTIDSLTTMALESNQSAVRTDTGFEIAAHITPGFANTEEGYAAFLASRTAQQGVLVLNEVMAKNTVTWPDGDDAYADYIEVRNASDQAVNLKGYGLSNTPDAPLKWQFPDVTLEPGRVILVFASGKGHSADESELHAPFRISASSDTVCLSSPMGAIIDQVEINGVGEDAALVRGEDGAWSIGEASPGQPNTEEGIAAYGTALDAKRTGPLRISEIMSRNVDYGAIPRSDWVEIHNVSDAPVNLKDYTLSNDPELPGLFQLPDVTIPAGGYRVIYCNEANLPKSLNIQTNFKMNGDGAVGLYDADGRLVDGMAYTGLPMNVSRGRMEGQSGFYYFETPTLGQANTGGKRKIASTPVATTAAGVYNQVDSVSVALSGDNIHYTLDGTVPTRNSPAYTGPIDVNKTTSVRAVSFADGAVPSACMTASYIVNENHTMDVVSVTSDPDGLFSTERGIMVQGKGASQLDNNCNYFQDWERYGHVELLKKDGSGAEFSMDCGLKIFGGMSRIYEKKSLALNFRDCYGQSWLEDEVFESRDIGRYHNLILRTSGQDRINTLMKDAMFTSILDDAGVLPVQAYRPVIMYINGEYYGIRYIRERINAEYVATHFGTGTDTLDMLTGTGSIVNAGSNEDYKALIQYVTGHDLRNDENYQYVIDRINPVNYCDYIITEAYCGNQDSGNIRFFRSPDYDNGRWNWIVYDTDLGFQNAREVLGFYHIMDPAGTGNGHNFSTILIRKLLQNSDFRALFVERLEYMMKNVFVTDNILARIDQFQAFLSPEIGRDLNKWRSDGADGWESRVDGLRTFIKNRQGRLKDELRNDAALRNIIALTDEELTRIFG